MTGKKHLVCLSMYSYNHTEGQKPISQTEVTFCSFLCYLLVATGKPCTANVQLPVTEASHKAVTKVKTTINFNNSPLPVFLSALDICSWCQSLCLWSECNEDSTDFHNLVSSILRSSSYQLCSLANNIHTIL